MSRPRQPEDTSGPAIVLIGGGTGSFTLLQSLKRYTPNITALVNMADDGGSTGVLRDELGVLPPGDVRQCLVALSEAPEEMRELFNFRFAKGSLAGHSFGNLFLSAVEKMTDNFADGVRIASEVLRITGRVIPITLDRCDLVLDHDGQRLVGEYQISQQALAGRPQLSLTPPVTINPEARTAIGQADLVIIAPGNLYGSIAPALLVGGVAEALQQTAAEVVYVCNLVNKTRQTPDFMVHDYAAEIERFAGSGVLDFVLYNVDMPSDELLRKYALEDEFPVLFDQAVLDGASYDAVPGPFLSRTERQRNQNDTRIVRSLIRHDADAIVQALKKLPAHG